MRAPARNPGHARIRRRRRVLSRRLAAACGRSRAEHATLPASACPCLRRTSRHETDGGRKRDPRLVLGRGLVPRPRRGDRARERAGCGGAEILDVGGESTRPGAEEVPRRRSCGGSSRWSPALAGARRRSRSTPRRPRSPRRRSTPARRSSTTSRRCAAIPRWRRSAPSASATVVLMHMLGTPRTRGGGSARPGDCTQAAGVHRQANQISSNGPVIITIGTPIDEFLNPVRRVVQDCIDALLPALNDGQLIILRSTVFPGTTDWLASYLQRQRPQAKDRVLSRTSRTGQRIGSSCARCRKS